MAKPTYNDMLPNVQVIEDVNAITATVSPTAPGVFIPWDFFNAVGMSNPVSLDNPEALLAAVLLAAEPWYRADTTEQPNIEFDQSRPTIISRNGENKLAYQMGVTLYQDFTLPTIDPDLIATS